MNKKGMSFWAIVAIIVVLICLTIQYFFVGGFSGFIKEFFSGVGSEEIDGEARVNEDEDRSCKEIITQFCYDAENESYKCDFGDWGLRRLDND